jgi:hypothetical protein
MRDVVAAAARSSATPLYRAALAAVFAIAAWVYLAACQASLPSGVFSCANGKRCPPGQTCGADDLCRSDRAHDASADSGGDERDSAADDGSTMDSDAAMDPKDSGEPSGGKGGNGGGGSGGAAAAGSGGSGGGGNGGGGAGGAGGQGTVEGFHVRSTVPAMDQAVLEDLGAALKVTFSAAVDEATLTSESFSLEREGESVAGALHVSSTEVTFQPDQPWTLAASYELKLTAAVHDATARALEPFTFTFETRDGRWFREQRADGTNAGIAVSGDGYAFLVWSKAGSMYPEMWSRQFNPPSAWASEQMIAGTNAGWFFESLVVNRRHRAAVSYSSISSNVSVVPYTTGPNWGASSYVSQSSYNTRMFLSESDECFAVVDQPDLSGSSGYGIKGARFTLGNINPTPIAVGGTGGNNTKPSIALLDGDPRVIWQHAGGSSGGPYQITSGGLSGASGTPLSANGVSAANGVLTGDPRQSSIIAAWEQSDPSWTNAWAARIVIGANWSAPVRISNDQSSASDISVAIDPSGRALAVWRQGGGISATHFTPGTGWSAAERISSGTGNNADAPKVILDAAGNGIAAWTQDGAEMMLNEVWIARFLRDGGWQADRRVRVSDVEAATGDKLSLGGDDYGRAFVVWIQSNQVWSARFD